MRCPARYVDLELGGDRLPVDRPTCPACPAQSSRSTPATPPARAPPTVVSGPDGTFHQRGFEVGATFVARAFAAGFVASKLSDVFGGIGGVIGGSFGVPPASGNTPADLFTATFSNDRPPHSRTSSSTCNAALTTLREDVRTRFPALLVPAPQVDRAECSRRRAANHSHTRRSPLSRSQPASRRGSQGPQPSGGSTCRRDRGLPPPAPPVSPRRERRTTPRP